jgi:formamidopyrimidine-DNA glycosylase
MPELPELQALAERLNDALAGRALVGAEVLQFSALKTVIPSPLDLEGRTLQGVGRRGKYLIFNFGSARVLVHLSQGGRVEVEDPPKKTRPRGVVMRMSFDDSVSVLVKEFGTERKAAWWVLDPADQGPLAGLGPEPFGDEFKALVLEGDDNRQLHTLLRDQKVVAGIGRGFADDILHAAMISPFTPLSKLDPQQRRLLLDSVLAVMSQAIERERERSGGLPAKMGDRFTIHNRHGQSCPRCGDTMRRVSFNSREVTYCPTCQTDGKVLADRRLSRLLR